MHPTTTTHRLRRYLLLALGSVLLVTALAQPAGAGWADGTNNPYDDFEVTVQVMYHRNVPDACGGPEFIWKIRMRDFHEDVDWAPMDEINNPDHFDRRPYVNSQLHYNTRARFRAAIVFVDVEMIEEDDFFCGGADDNIDLSPMRGTRLRLMINTYTGQVVMFGWDGATAEISDGHGGFNRYSSEFIDYWVGGTRVNLYVEIDPV